MSATLRILQRAYAEDSTATGSGSGPEGRVARALHRERQRQERVDADGDAAAEAQAQARSRTEAALAPPVLSVRVSAGQRVAEVLSHSWPSLSQRRAERAQSPGFPCHYRFHQYILHLDGVRCERNITLLTRKPLPLDSMPPLHFYPHGVRQRTVMLLDAGPCDLSDSALHLAEQAHTHFFRILHARGGGGGGGSTQATHPQGASNESLAPCHAPSPFPDAPPADGGCWRSDVMAPKQYLLLPSVRKSHTERSKEQGDKWSHPDEHDSLSMSDLELQRELQWQAECRDSLMQGHGGRCGRPHRRQMTIEQTSCALDWSFMRAMVSPPLVRPADTSVASAPDRSTLLWTPYNDRLYVNLRLDQPVSATGNSPFPNPEYASYRDFYERKWRVPVPDPSAPLIAAVNFSLAPVNVLQPSLLTAKRKQSREPTILLLPAATRVLDVSPQWMFVLRILPCIMQRIETNLLHVELAHTLALKQLRPYPLRMALTASNAQESYALPFAPDHSCSALNLQAAADASAASVASAPTPATDVDSLFSSMPFLTPTPPSHAAPPPPPPPPAPPSPSLPFSYDRLKFIGDSALKLVLTKLLLVRYPHENEEGVTRRKGALLNSACLAACALRMGLQRFVVAHPPHPAQFRPPGFIAEAETVRGDGGGSSSSVGRSSASESSTPSSVVSPQVLADVISSLVGCAWMSGAEACCAQMVVALGLIDPGALLRIDALPVPPEDALAPFASHPRLQMLLASQGECERIIDYRFRQRALYVQTFWHERWSSTSSISSVDASSHPHPPPRLPSYERLELLGDAVLELCVSSCVGAVFTRTGSSGDLTFLRQKLVSNHVLATAMRHSDLHPFVEPAPANAATSGAPPPKLLADVLEALLGAVYVDSDCSLAEVWKVYLRLVPVVELNTYTHTVRIQHG